MSNFALFITLLALNAAPVYGQTYLHLNARDSVRVLYRGPEYVRGQVERLQVDYLAIDPLADTVALRARATMIYTLVRGELDNDGLGILTVRAVHYSETPPNAMIKPFRTYGYVIKKRSDGEWYFDGSASPIPKSATHSGEGARPTRPSAADSAGR